MRFTPDCSLNEVFCLRARRREQGVIRVEMLHNPFSYKAVQLFSGITTVVERLDQLLLPTGRTPDLPTHLSLDFVVTTRTGPMYQIDNAESLIAAILRVRDDEVFELAHKIQNADTINRAAPLYVDDHASLRTSRRHSGAADLAHHTFKIMDLRHD